MRRGLTDRSRASVDGDALSVTALTRKIKTLLEGGIGRVSVEGEISNITRASSGHIYLSLKDEHALISAVMWRSSAGRLGFEPVEGDKVIARGEISVYEPRGNYQLVISTMNPAGQGDLQRRFEELVAKLGEEGLFLSEHKKPLPSAPATVGVVTSATGAAFRDIIKVMQRRAPGVRIVLSPCLVQGKTAAQDIVRALARLERFGECDVIILGRGGGSLEDLWAFNEEPVARAIFAASTPVISAVGHEIDTSIADLVADFRAATPSEAAEAVVPDLSELSRRVMRLERALASALSGRLREGRIRLSALARSPVVRRPIDMIRRRQQQLDEMQESMSRAITSRADHIRNRLALAAARLEALSPLGVLARGYSLTMADGKVITDAGAVKADDTLTTRVARGSIRSIVVDTEVENG